MKVYNIEKTEILTEYDLETGYLKPDTITHIIPAVEEVEEVSHIEPIQGYEHCFKRVIDIQGIKGVPEHEETEEIQVYIPYTLEEIESIYKKQLRTQRNNLLQAFDKWEKAVLRGRETDSETIMQWFNDLLDLKENAFDNIPERIRYYL